jgi:putative ABC transport system permease protein
VIKIISLTSGLAVALVLFSKVAFEMSYDKFYPDADRLYRIQRKIYNLKEDKVGYDGPKINAPLPNALKTELSEIEASTVIFISPAEDFFQIEDKIFGEKVVTADTGFFDLFGIALIEGDKRKLDVDANVFLSQSAAYRFFGTTSPVGKTILKGSAPLTVAGVFEDLPANSHLSFHVLTSLPASRMPGWNQADAFMGYVKLAPGVAAEEVEAKIPDILPLYYDVKGKAERGDRDEYFLNPVATLHTGETAVKRVILTLSIFAFSLLFIAAMNYVLISISSLARRAISVSIHKCNGASGRDIFGMLLSETAAFVCLALLFAAVLILAFRQSVEAIIQTPLSAVFSFANLWAAPVVIICLMLFAGIIPAYIFSSVPVTHLIQSYSTNKRVWKHTLLFVQFATISFIFALLVIIIKQYNLLVNHDPGYTVENMVYSDNTRYV